MAISEHRLYGLKFSQTPEEDAIYGLSHRSPSVCIGVHRWLQLPSLRRIQTLHPRNFHHHFNRRVG